MPSSETPRGQAVTSVPIGELPPTWLRALPKLEEGGVTAASSGKEHAHKRAISAAALMAKQFEPVNYVVPGLIAEGVTLFGGKPKIGKSWMALDLALAIAGGWPVFGILPVMQGDVLYLALEDSERRLKSRMIKKALKVAPERLMLATEWPDLDSGCIADLDDWADNMTRPALVIVDVLKQVRPRTRINEQLYDSDYRSLAGLGRFARRRGIAVLVVHHVRKMEADDPLESLSGTNGLTGAADSIMVLKRDVGTGNCTLYVRGRDIEESEKVVRFVAETGTWDMIGDATEVGRTTEREAIISVLRQSDKALGARDVSDISGQSYGAVRRTLARMAHDGEIAREGRGLYTLSQVSQCPNEERWDNGTIETDTQNDKVGATQ
jgi:hypothetical protein